MLGIESKASVNEVVKVIKAFAKQFLDLRPERLKLIPQAGVVISFKMLLSIQGTGLYSVSSMPRSP